MLLLIEPLTLLKPNTPIKIEQNDVLTNMEGKVILPYPQKKRPFTFVKSRLNDKKLLVEIALQNVTF